MDLSSQIATRLKEERKRLGLGQEALAEACGISREMYGKYERDLAVPGGEVLARAASAQVDVLYVLTGEYGPRPVVRGLKSSAGIADSSKGGRKTAAAQLGQHAANDGGPGSNGGPLKTRSTDLPPSLYKDPLVWPSDAYAPLVFPVLFSKSNTNREYQVIPRYSAKASAGLGLGNAADMDLDDAGYVAFDRRWMQETFGRSDGLATVEVHGDSMEPTLADGETIVIDTRVNKADASGVYVIRVGGSVLVKRLQRKIDGTLIIKSDNPAYEPEVIRPGERLKLQVDGRMVWPRMR